MSENKEKGDTPHELPVVRQSQVKTEETYMAKEHDLILSRLFLKSQPVLTANTSNAAAFRCLAPWEPVKRPSGAVVVA